MKIYSQEKTDGLEEVIQANASLAYVSQLRPSNPDESQKLKIKASLESSKANSNKDQTDLYYIDSVLVTTCWNNNDDVFNKNEVWAARKTPEDKPFNLEHDEHDILGHITGNWVIDDSGNLLDDSTTEQNLPDTYHIVTSSVMYKHWTDPKLIVRTYELIESIEAGEKFVSMECLFNDFDYAIKAEDGAMHTLARTAESAFLTKHLRAYGGTGVYQGYKIGRLLKNIAFCGHGLVAKPANPSSIIFDKFKPFIAPTEGSLQMFENIPSAVAKDSSEEETEKMADINVDFYKKQVDELKASVDSLSVANKELEDKLTEAGVKEYEAKIAELEATLAANLEAIEAQKSELQQVSETVSEANQKVEEAEAKLAEAETAKSEIQSKLDEIEAEKVRSHRISALVEAGLETEEAEAAIEKFADLNDEQFDALALMVAPKDEDKDKKKKKEEAIDELMGGKKPKAIEEPKGGKKPKASEAESQSSYEEQEEDITEDAAEAAAEEADLDNVETLDEVSLAASGDEEDEVQETRAALSELIAQKYLQTTK